MLLATRSQPLHVGRGCLRTCCSREGRTGRIEKGTGDCREEFVVPAIVPDELGTGWPSAFHMGSLRWGIKLLKHIVPVCGP